MVEFNKKVLSSGLTVLHEKRDVPVTTVMLGINYGSAFEAEKEKGIAHFIEHMCFKGTDKRTTKQVANEIEKIGGDLNAFTTEEITVYRAKVPSKYLSIAAEVIFDIFFNASFPEEEFEKESAVILEELKMYSDSPPHHTLIKIDEMMYEKPFGMFTIGTSENIKGFTREQIFEKHRGIYVPSNSILCVVGNNDFEEIVSLAEKFVVEREGTKPEKPEIVKKVSNEIEKRENLQQANLTMGFHFPSVNDENRFAAEVFSGILGSGMSSKLFEEVREKRGLVYGIGSMFEYGDGFGTFVIKAGTDPSKVEEVLKVSSEEFSKMKDISEEELAEGKRQVVGLSLVHEEDSEDTARNLIEEEFYDKAENYYSYEKNIEDVNLEQIKKLAEKTEYSSFVLSP